MIEKKFDMELLFFNCSNPNVLFSNSNVMFLLSRIHFYYCAKIGFSGGSKGARRTQNHMLAPPPEGWRPHLGGEILDPPVGFNHRCFEYWIN